MSEDKKINAAKISDENLDGVNGGVMIRTDLGSAGKAGNAVYNMNENAGFHTALKDDTIDEQWHQERKAEALCERPQG